MGLRAQWIVDPTDHSGRRLIAVWSRPAVPTDTATNTPVLQPVSDELPDEEEWPQAS